MSRARELLADAIKYSLSILGYLFIQSRFPAGGLGTEWWAQILTALVASAVTVVVIDVVFGRPQLRANWTIRNQPVTSGWAEIDGKLSGPIKIIGLNYTFHGNGLLYKLAERMASEESVSCTLILLPSEALTGSVEKGSRRNSFIPENGNLVTSFNDGFSSTGSLKCEFQLYGREEATLDQEVACRMRLERTSKAWLLRLLVKCDVVIIGFKVRGS